MEDVMEQAMKAIEEVARMSKPIEEVQVNQITKVDHTLLPADALEAVSRVLMHGEDKYGAWNWANNPSSHRHLLAKAIRHILAFQRGMDDDTNTGYPNLAHAICDLLFLQSNVMQGRGVDDRYPY
jgi:dATP/dGTP diphosphohydrolase, N-terminal